MNREQRRAFIQRTVDLHYCPNTQRIIESAKHDDKALCPCGERNPDVPKEHPGVHLKSHLRAAPVDDFMAQEEARLGITGDT